MEPRRPKTRRLKPKKRLGAGPGRLTRAYSINQASEGADLCDAQSAVYLADGAPVADLEVVTTTRIGITKGADLLWRWYVSASPFVSKR